MMLTIILIGSLLLLATGVALASIGSVIGYAILGFYAACFVLGMLLFVFRIVKF